MRRRQWPHRCRQVQRWSPQRWHNLQWTIVYHKTPAVREDNHLRSSLRFEFRRQLFQALKLTRKRISMISGRSCSCRKVSLIEASHCSVMRQHRVRSKSSSQPVRRNLGRPMRWNKRIVAKHRMRIIRLLSWFMTIQTRSIMSRILAQPANERNSKFRKRPNV